MKVQQVRNATLIIEYAGKRFLVDPMAAEKEAYPGFEGTATSHLRNPLVDARAADFAPKKNHRMNAPSATSDGDGDLPHPRAAGSPCRMLPQTPA